MSVLNTLPAPVIQMGLVEKLVDVQQNQPHVQQLVAQESAKQALLEAKSRVAGVDNSENGKKVREKSEDQDTRGRSRSRKRKVTASFSIPDLDEADESEAEAPRTKPWSGHILNIKI